MKKAKKIYSILVCAVAFAGNLFAFNNAKEIVNEKYWDELEKNRQIEIINDETNDESIIFPNCSAREIFDAHRVVKNPKGVPFFLETLFLLNKEDLKKDGKTGTGDVSMDAAARIFRSVSDMEGMTYYSQRQKKETVLYEKAYSIVSATDSTKIPDTNTGNANGQILYSFQEDNTFGPCRYELSYWQTDDVLYAIFHNLDPYKLFGITGIAAHNLRIHAVIFDCGEDLLLYIAADVSGQKVPGVRKQITDSMVARVYAIVGWLKKQF